MLVGGFIGVTLGLRLWPATRGLTVTAADVVLGASVGLVVGTVLGPLLDVILGVDAGDRALSYAIAINACIGGAVMERGRQRRTEGADREP